MNTPNLYYCAAWNITSSGTINNHFILLFACLVVILCYCATWNISPIGTIKQTVKNEIHSIYWT